MHQPNDVHAWAAAQVAAMLERVRRMVLAEYARRAAELRP